jgi:hypothetical protein
MDYAITGIVALMIPILALSIPIVAILLKPISESMHKRERAEARKTYERIALEKLEVIKTALAMGYTHSELQELDARLERLVGADKLQTLLDGTQPATPVAQPELLDSDLEAEILRLRNGRRERERGL